MKTSKKAYLMPIAMRLKQKLTLNATKAEIKMKAVLIGLKVPYQFQQIIFTYDNFFIADFVVTNKKGKRYLLELDGSVHFNYKAKKKDANRSVKIRQSNYGVLRFKNDDVLKKPEKVLKKLKQYEII